MTPPEQTSAEILQTWKTEFTKWMREPEQYRHLMTDRLNKMFARLSEQEKRIEALIEENASLEEWAADL